MATAEEQLWLIIQEDYPTGRYYKIFVTVCDNCHSTRPSRRNRTELFWTTSPWYLCWVLYKIDGVNSLSIRFLNSHSQACRTFKTVKVDTFIVLKKGSNNNVVKVISSRSPNCVYNEKPVIWISSNCSNMMFMTQIANNLYTQFNQQNLLQSCQSRFVCNIWCGLNLQRLTFSGKVSMFSVLFFSKYSA